MIESEIKIWIIKNEIGVFFIFYEIIVDLVGWFYNIGFYMWLKV